MLLKKLVMENAIRRGDVVIYKWFKEETSRDGILGRHRMLEYYVAFMVSLVERGVIHDTLGPFPQENAVAVYKPMIRSDRALATWKKAEERMCTETFELLVNRLLDVFPDAYLLKDDTYFEVVRRQSLTHYQLVEASPEWVAQLERDRSGRESGADVDVMKTFSRIVERRGQDEESRRRS